jgi:hypothetical protein
MKQHFFISLSALLILSAFSRCDSTNTNTVNHTTDTVIQVQPAKSDNEVLIEESGKAIGTLIDKGIERKQYNDSVRAANKDEFWAFTIGVPFTDADKMAETFEKIKDIEGIAVFEQSDEYTIIKTGNSEEELQDLQGKLKEQLSNAKTGISHVEITNLAEKCGRKGHIVSGQNRKLKRKHPEIPCYICN